MHPLKIKRLNPAVNLPAYAKAGDAGLDLQAAITAPITLQPGQATALLPTGLAMEIPEGHFGLVVPRSSLGKRGLMLGNTAGVIDSGYRGELSIIIRNVSDTPQTLQPMERLCQLLIVPFVHAAIEEVTELSTTSRGTTGFGSSGTH